ncbi:phosphodiester glycosidase family protein [Clostridium sardiniense]|uniref:phosphodiester glycosidase family protein n=1 Tax=Clostridium sardiniense TaxID=29369 RepID=UPI003D34E6DA
MKNISKSKLLNILVRTIIIAIVITIVITIFINYKKLYTDNYVFSDNIQIEYHKDENNINYRSPSMDIKIENVIRENSNIDMWVVDIKVKSANQIKSAFAGNKFTLKEKEKTSTIAKRNNAILAINGSAYGFNDKGFVIRDKVLYRETSLDVGPLIIKDNGDFAIYDQGKKTGQEMLDLGAMHVYDFGPDLIRDGDIVDYGDTWYKDDKQPRTVIGQKGSLEYVIIVVDGRSRKSEGMSLYDVALELENRGCYVGYNLDGGGSTTLYFNGKVLNNPSDILGERKISDILYFTD